MFNIWCTVCCESFDVYVADLQIRSFIHLVIHSQQYTTYAQKHKK